MSAASWRAGTGPKPAKPLRYCKHPDFGQPIAPPGVVPARLIALILILAAAPAGADFQAGLEAYRRGDYAAALEAWLPIAERGDANAQYNVGLLYARGEAMPQDFPQAAGWYRKAAEQGVAAAQYNLAVIHANGQGVPQDMTEAIAWFRKAAEQGVPEAQDSLGYIYGSGQGVRKDFAEALKWYRLAAEKGVAGAQYNLGVMYDLGQGVERDFDEALSWYRKAADQGYAAALCNIGILYYNAQGVKRDLVESYAWVSRCEDAGDPRAPQLRRILESRLKKGDLERGRELAAAWQPPGPPPASRDTTRLFAGTPPSSTDSSSADRSLIELAPPETGKASGAVTEPAGVEAGSAPVEPPAPPAEPPKPKDATTIQDTWNGVERVVAVGDVFGDFEQFFAVLESAGLIDSDGNWTGGAAHLVQTGNVVNRGPDSRKIMDLLMRLEKQAAAAGGAVHCLVGSQEAMNVYGDLRYVADDEFASFLDRYPAPAGASYQRLREAANGGIAPEADRSKWIPAQPPGFEEHRRAFAPTGKYGAWIAGHNASVMIDGNLFVHAGIGPQYAGWGMRRINEAVRAELAAPDDPHVLADAEGPLWYEGLASGDESATQALVDRILADYGAHRIIVGHADAGGAVTSRFGGRVLLVNAGISRIHPSGGRLACLVIEGGKPYALYRGQKLELPKDNGPDLLRYLKEIAALDPQPLPLAGRIESLARAEGP